MACFSIPALSQVPSDLMDNCNQWKITYPTGVEDKTLCNEPNNEFFYVNSAGNAIVFYAPIRNDNGSTPNSDNIRSELREREPDGSVDIYWTTEGRHMLYVKQAITHLPINKSELVATQIHGNKDDGIDDAMVMRLEDSHLFLAFNGGELRSDVTIKTNYSLGTIHEVIFLIVDGKHYCYYSEDGNLLSAYNNGNGSSYLVKDGSNDYVMDRDYDDTYFKVGNYTQSNPDEEGNDTGDPDNYGEVLVYDFSVQHGDDSGEQVDVTGVSFSSSTANLSLGGTQALSASVSPSNASNKGVSYSSNNTSVATVSSNGVVTAIAEGSATITVTTDDGGFTDTITVNVIAPSTGTNLALNKSISGTGTPDGSNVVANLVDGSTSTRWSVEGFPQTATIDLGSVFTLGSTEMVCYSDRDYQYTVSVSNAANGSYTQVVNRSGNTTPGTVASPIIDTFSDIDARYVKVTVTGAGSYTGSWVSLLEMRVFEGDGGSQTIPVTGVSITPSSTSLTTGGTQQLSASVTPSNASNQDVSYSSNNTSVAVVNSSGVVTAISEGNATITGTTDDGGFTDTVAVTVTGVSTGTNLALNKSISGTGTPDGSYVVANLVDGFTSTRWSVSGFPQSATIDLGSVYTLGRTELVCYADRAYQYTVSVSNTANGSYTQVVNRSGNTTPGTVATPIVDTFSNIGARYVRITVTDANSYTGEWVSLLEMRVFAGDGGSNVAVTGLSMTPSSASLTIGDTQQLSSSVAPSNASNQGVSYSSNNTSVATVNSSGVVTAIGEGNATITGTTDDGGFTDTTAVTVTDTSIDTNLALYKSISGTGTPDGTNVVANLVDGSTSTRWSVSGFPQTATIDLGSVYTLGRTELVCYADRDYQYTVSVSSTANGNYTQVVNRSGNTTPGTVASPIIDYFSDIDARYVKITITDANSYTGTWVSLLEMRVFGEGGSYVPVTGVSMTPSSVSLTTSETQQLSSSVAPSNASNHGVSYSSNNTSVATVSSSGVVTGISTGSATITGTTNDGSFTDSSVVTVSSSGSFDAPYDIPKFRDYLSECKLQSPGSGTEATDSDIISGYSSNTFYVVDGDKVAFYQTGASARTELRFLDNWYINSTNKTLHANVKIVQQTCDQLTIMQIHDDANVGNGPNKPLLRIYKSTTKSPVNHLWAAIKTNSGGVDTEHIDLGLAPSGYFDCDISIESGDMIIEINGSEEVNKDVSFWTFPSYWKNGVYLQDSGAATTYFNELTLSNSSTSKSSTTKTTSAFTLEEEVALSLWPNPVINTVNINGTKDFHTLIVYDLLGNLIIRQAIQGESVDVSNLSSGLYLFKLLGKEKTINKRVIKK
ncbi:hypothetical protein GCM10022397_06560 [Flavivirga jejuensis]